MREITKKQLYLPTEGGNGNGGGGGGDSSFNGNRPITRKTPGIENVNAGGATVKEFLENLMFPAVSPGCTLSVNNPIREIGESTAYTLNWTAIKQTNLITSIVVDGAAVTPITGENQSGTVTGSLPASSGDYTKSMTVASGALSSGASVAVNYRPRMFFGTINKNTGITNADILAILGSELRTNRNKSFTNFGGGGEYLIFVVPVAFGVPSFTINGLANTAFTNVLPGFAFVNTHGATVPVNVIISNNIYNSPLGSINLS